MAQYTYIRVQIVRSMNTTIVVVDIKDISIIKRIKVYALELTVSM